MRVKVVIDTNILVPSLYFQTHIFQFIKRGNLIPLWNNFIYNEAHEIIDRLEPVFSQRGLDTLVAHKICDRILEPDNRMPEMPDDWPPQCSDRDDDQFLWVAYVGESEFIITEDNHLLNIRNFRGIPIGIPSLFFAWAKKNRPMA